MDIYRYNLKSMRHKNAEQLVTGVSNLSEITYSLLFVFITQHSECQSVYVGFYLYEIRQ